MDAVYWPSTGRDRFNKITYGTAEDLKVFWVDKIQEVVDHNGQTVTSSAMVFSGKDLTIEGMLWRGTKSQLAGDNLTDPRKNAGAFAMRAIGKTPTLNAKQFARVNYL